MFAYRFYQGQVTPEITEVSKFMETILNNCSEEVRDPDRDPAPDPTEEAFLVLRVSEVPLAFEAVPHQLVECDSSSLAGCWCYGSGHARRQPITHLLDFAMHEETRCCLIQSEGSYPGLQADGHYC